MDSAAQVMAFIFLWLVPLGFAFSAYYDWRQIRDLEVLRKRQEAWLKVGFDVLMALMTVVFPVQAAIGLLH